MEGKHFAISGHAEPGFEGVAGAFAENFVSRNELGAACCMYVDGTEVVDLWGGVRNRKTGEPWERNTMVIVWSATIRHVLEARLAALAGLCQAESSRVGVREPERVWHARLGGTLAYANPEVKAGYAYIANRVRAAGADPREIAIQAAVRLAALERHDLDDKDAS